MLSSKYKCTIKMKSLFKMAQFQALKDNDDANDSVDKYWEQSVAVRPICQCVAPSRWMSGCLHDRKSTVAHSCFMKLPIGSHSSRSRQWRRTGRGTTRKRAKPTRTSPLLVYHVCSFGNTRTQVLLCIKAGWVVPPLLVIMSRAGRADTRLYGWVQVSQCQLALGVFLISTFCHWDRRFQL